MQKILVLLLNIACSMLYADSALVVLPVIDLYGTAQASQAPLDAKPASQCSRLMQLLFHEQVHIVQERGDAALIAVPYCFHCDVQNNNKKITTYWTKKSNLMRLTELNPHELALLPPTVTYENPKSVNRPLVVVLAHPWYSSITQQYYSVGTRFVVKKRSHADMTVYLFDYRTKKVIADRIPKKYTIRHINHASADQHRESLIDLVRCWAHEQKTLIPYVFGGSSYLPSETPYNPTILLTADLKESRVVNANNNKEVYSGFDCAGVIMRAAQCCGIPLFYKNSLTMARNLEEVRSKDLIKKGDIIWIPGHVMLVADVQKGTLLEARSLYHGYGYLQEIQLHEEFKDIQSYDDLMRAKKEGRPLIRLDKKGDVIQTIKNFKILSLANVL